MKLPPKTAMTAPAIAMWIGVDGLTASSATGSPKKTLSPRCMVRANHRRATIAVVPRAATRDPRIKSRTITHLCRSWPQRTPLVEASSESPPDTDPLAHGCTRRGTHDETVSSPKAIGWGRPRAAQAVTSSRPRRESANARGYARRRVTTISVAAVTLMRSPGRKARLDRAVRSSGTPVTSAWTGTPNA